MVSSHTDQNPHHKNSHGKKNNASNIAETPKEIKLPPHGYGNNDAPTGGDEEGSLELDRFLEDVLKAHDELRWIDRVVNDGSQVKKNGHSKSSYREDVPINVDRSDKLRDKRGFDQSYETMWMLQRKKFSDESAPNIPQKVYLNSDAMFDNDVNRVDLDPDPSKKKWSGKEIRSSFERRLDGPVYEKGAMDDQALKDWARVEDLRSSSDWLNSNKNLNSKEGKRQDRWIGAYESQHGNNDNPVPDVELDTVSNMRHRLETPDFSSLTSTNNIRPSREPELSRRETELKQVPVSLKFLKETVLELKRNLVEGHEKSGESRRNLDSVASENNVVHVVESENLPCNKNQLTDKSIEFHWKGAPNVERLDVKKFDKKFENPDGKGDLKFAEQLTFDGPYFVEQHLQGSHNRKRRSKEASADEKYYPNERENKSEMSITSSPQNDNQWDSSINNSQCINHTVQETESTTNSADTFLQVSATQNGESAKVKESETRGKSDSSEKNLNMAENTSEGEQPMKAEETVGNLGGNSSQTFGFAMNELQAASAKTSANADGGEEVRESRIQRPKGRQENVGPSQGEQVIKVFEPQEHLYQTSGSTKEVERIEPDEKEPRKLSLQMSEVKNTKGEPENINVLLKSENRNLIRFTNAANKGDTLDNRSETPEPVVFDEFNMEKKVILEKKDSPDNPVSTLFDMKIEQAHLDTSEKVKSQQMESVLQTDANNLDSFDPEGNGDKDKRFQSISRLSKDSQLRDVNGERLKDSMGSVKGLSRSGDNEGSQNRYGDAVRKQMGIRTGQSAGGKCNLTKYEAEVRIDTFGNRETAFEDAKRRTSSNDLGTDKSSIKDTAVASNQMSDNKRGANDKIDTGYIKRKILQKVEEETENDEEYLNEVEAAPVNGDEEDEGEDEDNYFEDNDSPEAGREERSAMNEEVDPMKAKVDVLIKQKLGRRNKENDDYTRKRRNPPSVIEYYDYNSDAEKQEHDARFVNSERQRIKNNHDQSTIESKINLADNVAERKNCVATGEKKNEQAAAMTKEERERERSKNKGPKEEFIVDLGQSGNKNVTEPSGVASDSSRSASKVEFKEEEGPSGAQEPRRLDQGEDNVSGINRGRLTRPLEQEEEILGDKEKYAEGDRKKLNLEGPVEYMLNVPGKLGPETIDHFLEDVRSIKFLEHEEMQTSKNLLNELDSRRESDFDQKNTDVETKEIKPLYDELKNVYDWSNDELKSRPRLKGDQRLYYETDNKLSIKQFLAEPLERENNNGQNWDAEQSERVDTEGLDHYVAATSRNENEHYQIKDEKFSNDDQDKSERTLQIEAPMQDVTSNGTKEPMADEKIYTASSGDSKNSDMNGTLRSNSFTLKSASDTSKCAVKEINATEEKLRHTVPTETTTKWEMQKVIDIKDTTVPRSNTIKWTLIDQRQYTNAKTYSPYENRENQEKQIAINSEDLHESFVEPLDWDDDFDNDIRVRLGRGLKTVDDVSADFTENKDVADASKTEETNLPSNTATSQCYNVTEALQFKNSSEDSSRLVSNFKRYPDKDNLRFRREVASPYTLYGDAYKNQLDISEADDNENKYLSNKEVIDDRLNFRNAYEDSNQRRYLELDRPSEFPQQFDSQSLQNPESYKKIIRSADAKRTQKHGKRKNKHFGKSSKKHRKKGRPGTSKHSRSSGHRRRREHKQHRAPSNVSKMKERSDDRSHVEKHKVEDMRLRKHANHKHRGAHKIKQVPKKHDRKPKYESAIGRSREVNENSGDRRATKTNDDAQRREFAVLLAAENIEDESQMDSALHGELAGKIVEQIFEQVHKNEALKTSFGPGLYRKHKPKDVLTADQNYRHSLNEDDVKHTEKLLKKIMDLLSRLIVDEVQMKTCVSLPPDSREFLNWMLDVNRQENFLEEAPTLPLVHDQSMPDHHAQNKFLFLSNPDADMNHSIAEILKKVRVMKSLINEYNALTEKEKTRVQSVHDYLAKQLDLLLKYIEAKEESQSEAKSFLPVGAARRKEGNILEYQSATSNATNGNYLNTQDTFPSLINKSNLLNLSDANSKTAGQPFHDNSIESYAGKHRAIRSLDKISQRNKKPKKNRKRKKHHRKHRKQDGDKNRASSNKNLVQKDQMFRQKRTHFKKDLLNSFNVKYGEPFGDETDAKYIRPNRILDHGINNKELDDKLNENSDSGRYTLTRIKRKMHILTDHENTTIDCLRKERPSNSAIKRTMNNHSTDSSREIRQGDLYDMNDKFKIKKRESPETLHNPKKSVNENSHSTNLTDVSNKDIYRYLSEKILNASIPISAFQQKSIDEGAHKLPTSPVSLTANDREEGILPIKGKNRVEDEMILLNKREAWKRENEEQLEEVAFGKDMRRLSRDKELFEKLIEMDKRKNIQNSHGRDESEENRPNLTIANNNRNESKNNCSNCLVKMNLTSSPKTSQKYSTSDEDKLKMLEQKINVFS